MRFSAVFLGVGCIRNRDPPLIPKILNPNHKDSIVWLHFLERGRGDQTVEVHRDTVFFSGPQTECARGRALKVVLPVDRKIRNEPVQQTLGDALAGGAGECQGN